MRYVLTVLLFMIMYSIFVKQFAVFTSYQITISTLLLGSVLLLMTIVFMLNRSINEK